MVYEDKFAELLSWYNERVIWDPVFDDDDSCEFKIDDYSLFEQYVISLIAKYYSTIDRVYSYVDENYDSSSLSIDSFRNPFDAMFKGLELNQEIKARRIYRYLISTENLDSVLKKLFKKAHSKIYSKLVTISLYDRNMEKRFEFFPYSYKINNPNIYYDLGKSVTALFILFSLDIPISSGWLSYDYDDVDYDYESEPDAEDERDMEDFINILVMFFEKLRRSSEDIVQDFKPYLYRKFIEVCKKKDKNFDPRSPFQSSIFTNGATMINRYNTWLSYEQSYDSLIKEETFHRCFLIVILKLKINTPLFVLDQDEVDVDREIKVLEESFDQIVIELNEILIYTYVRNEYDVAKEIYFGNDIDYISNELRLCNNELSRAKNEIEKLELKNDTLKKELTHEKSKNEKMRKVHKGSDNILNKLKSDLTTVIDDKDRIISKLLCELEIPEAEVQETGENRIRDISKLRIGIVGKKENLPDFRTYENIDVIDYNGHNSFGLNYDAYFISWKNMSHSIFYKSRDLIRSKDKPMGYIESTNENLIIAEIGNFLAVSNIL